MAAEQIKKPQDLKTLIIGAGVSGRMVVERMLSQTYNMPGVPIAIVDDDPRKHGHDICGVPIKGNSYDIATLVSEHDIDQIVFAIPSASREARVGIFDICFHTSARVVTLPPILGTPIPEVGPTPFMPVKPIDLLARDEIVLDTSLVSKYIDGKTVVVTGGGGSIGSEICRQLVEMKPKCVVAFDIYENTVYELQREMQEKCEASDIEFMVEIGSVRDVKRLQDLFDTYSPEVVFHAAAHKHVPLMEQNPREAVLNNVFGTLNTVKQACEHKVEHFVFISTDKAVNPTSVMGATKRMGEMIVQSYACGSDSVLTAVRFGNVLGSHGSVIPLFERQIREGGPVTVTHRDITRYFMTIPEASRLVITAGAFAQGGEIFILNMGNPVKIYDLAERMIRLSGLTPHQDIEIEVVGLRPGEKLYEELFMDKEDALPTDNKDIMLSASKPMALDTIEEKLRVLDRALSCDSPDQIKLALAEVIGTYKPDLGKVQ